MSRPNPAVLFGFFVAVIVAICGAELAKGALYLGKHEGDTFHLLDILFRMADGQWPHVDFFTPIGLLAFWPMALFVKLGFGVGTSIILGQILMVILALPAIWWTATTRLKGVAALLFGVVVIVLITALVHGETERSVSISMHYNRWAWAISFVVILLALLPSNKDRPLIDGFLIGLGMFALLMIKVTYFGAFAPAILLALLLRGAGKTLVYALATGLGLVLVLTIFAGIGFWQAYLHNLLAVAGSEIRAYPSSRFGSVMGAPAYMGASLTLILSVILLRQARKDNVGLVLLVLTPAFFYVTYQNFANDPQWLLLLGIILLANVPERDLRNGLGWDMRNAVHIAAAVALAMGAPSFFNLAYSPFRHLKVDVEKQAPFFVNSETHDDLFTARVRALRVDQRGPLDVSGTTLDQYADIDEAIEQAEFQGEKLDVCALELGTVAWFQAIVDDLTAHGFTGPGKSLLSADLFSSHWMFGELSPVKGGAPWYYGGLPGIEHADYLLVPNCPVIHEVRTMILKDVEESPFILTELHRHKLYTLYGLALPDGYEPQTDAANR